jgi:hypothetical protein
MPYLLIRETVRNHEAFHAVLDYDARRRQRLGCKGVRLMRNRAVPDDMFLLMEWEDAERALKYTAAYETQDARAWGGVVGEVKSFLLDEIEELAY